MFLVARTTRFSQNMVLSNPKQVGFVPKPQSDHTKIRKTEHFET